ncbi:hypothetical protein FACS1894199_04550 [Bacteroidia bacterium]|nr:hypothetical protein FACS1894199_04550 [Bacteroidia bacterium]
MVKFRYANDAKYFTFFCHSKKNTPSNPLSRYLTRSEAANTLRISISTLSRLVKNQNLPAKKVGRRVLFLESDIQSVILNMNV